MKWFKHDSDANMDAKLQKVTMKYGLEGYGLYWYCIEMIVNDVDNHNLTFELEHDSELLSFRTGIHQERLEEMMAHFVRVGLFENTGGVITCLKIAKRLDQSMTSNPTLRKKIATIHQIMPDRVMKISGQSHDGVMTESCKKRREEKRIEEKGEKRTRFVPPSTQDVQSYAQEKSFNLTGFYDHYSSNGWLVGKNKMKCWKSAASGWNRRQGQYTASNVDSRSSVAGYNDPNALNRGAV